MRRRRKLTAQALLSNLSKLHWRRAKKIRRKLLQSGKGVKALTVCRVIPLVAIVVAVALPADAQLERTPDLPAELSLACQHLLALRDQTQRQERAIQKANQRKASVQETCPLYRIFIIKETQLIRGIEEIGRACGIPSDFLKQARENHAKDLEIGKDVCLAAAQKKWPPGDYWQFSKPGIWPGR
jgi:hypothetical protein